MVGEDLAPPTPYSRPPSRTWWLKRRPYFVFVLREWSALFAAVYVISLVVLVGKVFDGEASFVDYRERLQSPVLLGFHAVALAFALLHTITWFQAVPKAMRLRIGERRVPPELLVGANYAAWAAVSVAVAFLFLLKA
jgi:fumarate reductase subunit C